MDGLLTLVDSLFTSLSDKLFRLRLEFEHESVVGSTECSESDRERGCFRDDRSIVDVASLTITMGSLEVK